LQEKIRIKYAEIARGIDVEVFNRLKIVHGEMEKLLENIRKIDDIEGKIKPNLLDSPEKAKNILGILKEFLNSQQNISNNEIHYSNDENFPSSFSNISMPEFSYELIEKNVLNSSGRNNGLPINHITEKENLVKYKDTYSTLDNRINTNKTITEFKPTGSIDIGTNRSLQGEIIIKDIFQTAKSSESMRKNATQIKNFRISDVEKTSIELKGPFEGKVPDSTLSKEIPIYIILDSKVDQKYFYLATIEEKVTWEQIFEIMMLTVFL